MTVPYARLSAIYFAYFAFVGAFAPYFSLYLKAVGASAWEIGVLISIMQLTRVFAPNFWAWVADHHGRRIALMRASLALAALSFCGIYATRSFWGIFVVLALLAFFSSAANPLLEATTFTALRGRLERYGAIRLWGSIGFIVAVLAVGAALDRLAIDNLLWMLLGVLALTAGLSWLLPGGGDPRPAERERIWLVLRRPEVLTLLCACFLMSLSHGPLFTFFSIYLTDLGYSKTAVGVLWSLGVIAEILVFLAAPRWFTRFDPRTILIASFVCAVARFLLIGWGAGNVALVTIAQILHAATFGSYHLAALALVNAWFTGARQVRGQALYLSLSFGAGGFLGGLASGALWGAVGPAWTFSASSVAAAAGLGVLLTRKSLLPPANPSAPVRSETL
ncbi:MAG: MFS transporter [Betaproteobacteria bacterium]|nr:MFS transporter [Betaproteobacteria bacterium]